MSGNPLPTPPSTPPLALDDTYSPRRLPVYSETDDDLLHFRIEQATDISFPIVHEPPRRSARGRWSPPVSRFDEAAVALEFDIVEAFFGAIETGYDELVVDFVRRGYVSPDITRSGETPLLAAVRAGKTPMVSRLVSLGATVNELGRSTTPVDPDAYPAEYPMRTPLMLAAERGNLALVRVLMEDYGADDSLVAPDGSIALRLAAMNGHRDIVEYLPSRRAGAWRRWKTTHKKETERMRRALHRIAEFVKFFVWYAPNFFFYHLPKEAVKLVWVRRHRIARWCKKIPGKVGRGVMKLPRAMVDGIKHTWKSMRKVPGWIKRLGLAIWRIIKAIPVVIKDVAVWAGQGFQSIIGAIFGVFGKFFSLLHTAVSAIFSIFRRITPKDVWDGFCYLLRALFIETPKAIFRFVLSVGDVAFDVLDSLLGCFGRCLWYLGAGVYWLIQYIPLRLWQILKAMGRSFRKAFQEVLAYMNPKRM